MKLIDKLFSYRETGRGRIESIETVIRHEITCTPGWGGAPLASEGSSLYYKVTLAEREGDIGKDFEIKQRYGLEVRVGDTIREIEESFFGIKNTRYVITHE
ncbi:hypothetical protein HYU11_01245 [Candidatus Woesearchaeota archaeon]|nr:hypothetical protein [Candidatus Woesearchaeota archaeon]